MFCKKMMRRIIPQYQASTCSRKFLKTKLLRVWFVKQSYKKRFKLFSKLFLALTILLVLVKEIFELLYEHTENPTAQTTSDCRILTAIYSRLIFLESLPFSGSYKSQKKNFFQSLNSNKETEISNSIKDNFKVQ